MHDVVTGFVSPRVPAGQGAEAVQMPSSKQFVRYRPSVTSIWDVLLSTATQPGSGLLHSVFPDKSWNQPSGQSSQLSPTFFINFPTAHGVHALDPRMLLEKPIGHSEHVVAFAADENLFIPQVWHDGAPTNAWYLPGRHGRQDAAPSVSWRYPTGQARHTSGGSAPERYCPLAHLAQEVPYSPAWHSWHDVDPGANVREPFWHFRQLVAFAWSV